VNIRSLLIVETSPARGVAVEALGPVEKLLLRMGPKNTRILQAKAREVAAALDYRIAQH